MTSTLYTSPLGSFEVPTPRSSVPFGAPTHTFCRILDLSFMLVIQLEKSHASTAYALKLCPKPTRTVLPSTLEDFISYTSLDILTPIPTGQVKLERYKATEFYMEPACIHPLILLAEEIAVKYSIRTFVVAQSGRAVNDLSIAWQCDPVKLSKLGTWFPTPVTPAAAMVKWKHLASGSPVPISHKIAPTVLKPLAPLTPLVSSAFI